jgi:hypothetical protein
VGWRTKSLSITGLIVILELSRGAAVSLSPITRHSRGVQGRAEGVERLAKEWKENKQTGEQVRILRFLVSHLLLDLGLSLSLCHQPTEGCSICRATCTERSYLSANERDQDIRKALSSANSTIHPCRRTSFPAVVVATRYHWSRHLQSPTAEPIFFAPHNKKGSSQ